MKTILMLHGWDYEYYNNINNKASWSKRCNLIKELEKYYNLVYFDFPGFGAEKEPDDKSWDLDHYAEYVENYIKNYNLNVDYILGYSFGGAVAIRWKTKYKKPQKLILISPAIIRKTINNKKYIKTPKSLDFIRNKLRNIYLIYIVKNGEMKYGTPFLRNTYQSIVREDLTNELTQININDLLLIFGDIDNMTPPKLLMDRVKGNILKRFNIIADGRTQYWRNSYK